MSFESYHDLILDEYERRKSLNPAYSLRAFARDLGVSAPRLNQVLSKKQGLSVKAAKAIAEKMNLSEKEQDWFCDSVGAFHARSFKERLSYQEKINEYKKASSSHQNLELEYFKVISDWYHFAILELTHLKDFKYDIKWISDSLGISKKEAQAAIKRLKELELVEEKNGMLIDRFEFLATPGDTPSQSIKKFNGQLLKKAISALQEQTVENREISSNLFAINKEDLPRFKKKIRRFRRELEAEANKNKTKNSVFCLGLQLFELTRSHK